MTESAESVEATLALAQQKTSLRAQFITKKSTNARFGLSPAEAGFFVPVLEELVYANLNHTPHEHRCPQTSLHAQKEPHSTLQSKTPLLRVILWMALNWL